MFGHHLADSKLITVLTPAAPAAREVKETKSSGLNEKLAEKVSPEFIKGLSAFVKDDFFTLSPESRCLELNSLRTNPKFIELFTQHRKDAAEFLKASVDNKEDLIAKLKENRLGQHFLMSVEERLNEILPKSYMKQMRDIITDNFFELTANARCSQLENLRHHADFLKLVIRNPKPSQMFLTESIEGNTELLERLLKTRLRLCFMDKAILVVAVRKREEAIHAPTAFHNGDPVYKLNKV